MTTVHVVGAGLAGLAAAVRLAGRGHAVAVHEAAPRAGGRCRSFHDAQLDRTIDNGNHLLLSGNDAVLAYLRAIGSQDAFTGPAEAAFPFVDLDTGRRWTVRPNRGPLPWWILARRRRIPGTRARDYLGGLRLATAPRDATVADVFGGDPLFRTFWEPLTLAVLNISAARGAARLLRPVLLRTFARGGAYCRPLIAREGLGPALVDPALAMLARAGTAVRLNRRLRRLETADGRAAALEFPDGTVPLGPDDAVVLAVAPSAAAALLPGLPVPAEGEVIVNAHFRMGRPPAPPDGVPFVGILGGTAHWAFVRGDVVSVTISGAEAEAALPAEVLGPRLWSDVARALDLPEAPVPPLRLIKERRATFTQTPDNLDRRPGPRTALANVVLAGDWTATGLPATIEGAVRSGNAAARAVGNCLREDVQAGIEDLEASRVRDFDADRIIDKGRRKRSARRSSG